MASSPSLIVMATLIWSLFAILGLASKTHKSAQKACYGLKASSAEIQTSGDEYDASEDDTPACVAFPTNAKQVSEIVQVLQEYTDVEFAMRSGGHNQNRGFSSVDGDVLISSNKLASTTYNSYSDCR
jgi:FAD/FMN-containing dehydrogenase